MENGNLGSCPDCGGALTRSQIQDTAYYWPCKSCGGCAVTLPVLRQRVTPKFVNGLWAIVYGEKLEARRACPACRHLMVEIRTKVGPKSVVLDACKICHLVWFDSGELALLPRIQPEDRKPQPQMERIPANPQAAVVFVGAGGAGSDEGSILSNVLLEVAAEVLFAWL